MPISNPPAADTAFVKVARGRSLITNVQTGHDSAGMPVFGLMTHGPGELVEVGIDEIDGLRAGGFLVDLDDEIQKIVVVDGAFPRPTVNGRDGSTIEPGGVN